MLPLPAGDLWYEEVGSRADQVQEGINLLPDYGFSEGDWRKERGRRTHAHTQTHTCTYTHWNKKWERCLYVVEDSWSSPSCLSPVPSHYPVHLPNPWWCKSGQLSSFTNFPCDVIDHMTYDIDTALPRLFHWEILSLTLVPTTKFTLTITGLGRHVNTNVDECRESCFCWLFHLEIGVGSI